MEVYPANYLSYDRENLTDLDCFLEKTCIFEAIARLFYPHCHLEPKCCRATSVRFVIDLIRLALVHRSWMDGEAERCRLGRYDCHYLGFIYSTEAGTDTIAASWAAIQLGDVSLPEDILKNQAIDGLRQNGVDLEAWFAAI